MPKSRYLENSLDRRLDEERAEARGGPTEAVTIAGIREAVEKSGRRIGLLLRSRTIRSTKVTCPAERGSYGRRKISMVGTSLLGSEKSSVSPARAP